MELEHSIPELPLLVMKYSNLGFQQRQLQSRHPERGSNFCVPVVIACADAAHSWSALKGTANIFLVYHKAL